MTRRFDWNGARSSWSTEKSMALLIEVLPANERGTSTSLSPKPRAKSPSAINVQSTTTVCMPVVAHSTKHTECAGSAGCDGPDHVGIRKGGSDHLRWRLNLSSVTLRETSAASTSSKSTGSAARATGGESVNARLSSAITILIA